MDFPQSSQNASPVRYSKGEPVPENRGEWAERGIGLCPILIVYLERMDVSPWESWKLREAAYLGGTLLSVLSICSMV
jgi:hypothetical protein